MNYQFLFFIHFCAISVFAYYGASSNCPMCSMYLEFSLWKLSNKKAEFRMLTISNQTTTCTIDYGDSTNEIKERSSGLTNEILSYKYKHGGSYDVICKCSDVQKSVTVTVKKPIASSELAVSYSFNDLTVKIELDKPPTCSGDCYVYVDKNYTLVDFDDFLKGYSETLREPGFHKVALKCNCADSVVLFLERMIHVYNPAFEEYLFPSLPRTTEEKPFKIYEGSRLQIDEVPDPTKNSAEITSREWNIARKNGSTFEAVNWTFSDEAIFPENVPFGLYRIVLNIASKDGNHSDILYLLYEKIIRPLKIYGGSIQHMRSSGKLRLFEEEHNDGTYYLWCFRSETSTTISEKPLFTIDLDKVDCGSYTGANFSAIPNNFVSTYGIVQVFAISETDFREGRSFFTVTNTLRQLPANIRCVYNCDGQVSAKINWVLQLEMENDFNQVDTSLKFEWTIFSNATNYQEYKKGEPIEGADTSALTIKSGFLNTKTWFKVCAKVSSASFVAFTCIEAFCGVPPSSGKCQLSSTTGTALETKFYVNCHDYVDDSLSAFRKNVQSSSSGIRYAVLLVTNGNLALLYYGVSPQIGPFYLDTGDLHIRVYDIYYSFDNITEPLTIAMPSIMYQSLEGIEKFLLERISSIDYLPRQDQLNMINSVSGIVNKMRTKNLLELIVYNVTEMTQGKFIDFDINTNTFKTWDEMMHLLENKDHREKVTLYSKIIRYCVEKIAALLGLKEMEVDVLSTLGTLSSALGYSPYVSQIVMVHSANISGYLLNRAVKLCEKPIISVFMTDIADCGETMLGRLMSVINTEQIVLAKAGFTWENVRKYMEKDQMYVNMSIIEIAMHRSEIDEFERFYLLQKTYLLSNVEINEKREQAERLSDTLVDVHLRYLKEVIKTISVSGRQSKSKAGTFVCAKKTAGTKHVGAIGCGQLDVHVGNDDSSTSQNLSDIQALSTNEKLFTYDKNMRSSLISQPTMILKMGNSEKNRSFSVAFSKSTQTPVAATPKFIIGDQTRLFYHMFLYRSKTDLACVRITPQIATPLKLGYEAYFRLLETPNNDTFHYRTAFSRENFTGTHYQFCVPSGVFKTNGSLYVGFRPFFVSGVSGEFSDLFAPYSFEAISANCLVWDELVWSGDYCQLVWTDHVSCDCSANKQVTVSNTFFVPPNLIDFSTVFVKFDIINNGTVFSVVLTIFLLFVIIFVIALRKDRKEEQMDLFRSLRDNHKDDSFYYLLIVYTGLKVGAGTQSNICFLLSGEHRTSGVRSLSDEAHKGFKSGSVRKFVMSTPDHLGDLLFLKIWTDASGRGEESSWFLDRFEVMEVNTEKTFIFRCNSWLTASDHGRPLYIIPCNRFDDEMTFACRFKENMYNSMTDGHLWFSAYMRPCYDQFTRAQRVTCCTLVLYLTMIINAMFYRTEENLVKPNQITLGPLRFSLAQIAISIQSIAITLPPTLLVLVFFKNSKPPKYKRPGKRKETDAETGDVEWDTDSGFSENGILPHWCVYIGWTLAFLGITASGFFVILFSMQWGKTKSEEWMTTFLLSSTESLFLVDPMKIFLIACIIACLRKVKQELKLTYLDTMSILQEIYNMHFGKKDLTVTIPIFAPMRKRERVRRQREVEREIWMKSIVLNFIMYALLLWSATGLAFSNRHPHALLFKDHLKNTFADPPRSDVKFSKISSVTSFYKWTRNVVYPNLFPHSDSMGRPLNWLKKKFIVDGVNVKIGPMRLRQLRLHGSEKCSTYNFIGIRDCYPAYSFNREEKGPHCLGWKKGTQCGYEMVYNDTLVAWRYTPAYKISGLPTVGIYNTYSGGGYILNMQVNDYIAKQMQDELVRAMWIDRNTRCVFLEFTLYNANSNQFANFLFLVEFPETGGAIPYYQINVITPYTSFDPYTIACLVAFGICFFMFIIKNAYNLLKERLRFFKSFWNLIDLCALITTSSVSVAYTMQYLGTEAVLEQFREDPRKFVNFYYLVLLNQLITYNLAFQIFFTIVRVSCILGISQRMSQIAVVMKRCASELVGVFYIFMIYALAFTMVGNLCFITTRPYHSYGSSLMTIMLLLLGKNNFHELVQVSPIIGKIYFVCQIFFMIFIILKMFESVLTDSISSKNKNKVQLSILNLFLQQLKTFRVVNKSKALKKKNRKDEIVLEKF